MGLCGAAAPAPASAAQGAAAVAPATAGAQPAAGAVSKTLRYAFPVAESGFDPAQISDLYSRTVVGAILEAPLEFEFLASPARMRPNTAAEMPEVSADFRTFTFRLKPGIHFHLVEPRARRARFLEQARIDLGLGNVQVHCARIEDWTPPVPVDAIICQAVGSLSYILGVTAHLHGHRAQVLALKGQRPAAELAALGPAAEACETIRLKVKGWAERHLERVDSSRLPAPG